MYKLPADNEGVLNVRSFSIDEIETKRSNRNDNRANDS